jgi:hypothetical protein
MLLRGSRGGQNSFSLVGVAASRKEGLGESRGPVGCNARNGAASDASGV